MKFQKPKLKRIINTILNILYIVLLIIIVERFGFGYGILSFLLVTLVTFLFKLYRERELVLSMLRQIEIKTFGKTLDRENWQKGEMARKKIKIVWGKPKNDNGKI